MRNKKARRCVTEVTEIFLQCRSSLYLKENVIQKELSLLLILTAMYIMLILMQDREKQLI